MDRSVAAPQAMNKLEEIRSRLQDEAIEASRARADEAEVEAEEMAPKPNHILRYSIFAVVAFFIFGLGMVGAGIWRTYLSGDPLGKARQSKSAEGRELTPAEKRQQRELAAILAELGIVENQADQPENQKP